GQVMNNCDARLAASGLYRASAGNKTAEDAEGRGGSVKQPLRTLRTLRLITKKINHRGHREHRELLFSSVSSVLSVVFRGFPNLIPKDNKKVSETSSNQIKDP
ncbi:MAG: hypothetical protein J7K15_01950, partial [Deltaproteobacteria bacterium]|nr:hypothetical protein [Deltaproteobacteria bacterium]